MTKARKAHKEPTKIGRLALRVEGAWWNAYWTKHQDSMNEAILLGSIRLNLTSGDVRDKFMDTMKELSTTWLRARPARRLNGTSQNQRRNMKKRATPSLKPMVGTYRIVDVSSPALWQRRAFNRKAGRWVDRHMRHEMWRLLYGR